MGLAVEESFRKNLNKSAFSLSILPLKPLIPCLVFLKLGDSGRSMSEGETKRLGPVSYESSRGQKQLRR
jgi:hypothetical protein